MFRVLGVPGYGSSSEQTRLKFQLAQSLGKFSGALPLEIQPATIFKSFSESIMRKHCLLHRVGKPDVSEKQNAWRPVSPDLRVVTSRSPNLRAVIIYGT